MEATPGDTESALRSGLRKKFPNIPDGVALPELFKGLREGSWIPAQRTVLVVLDQFEQWLHVNQVTDDSQLIQALRHCNAGRLQSVLMVRDDFFRATYHFMTAVKTPIRQDYNMKLVDLFNKRHARHVLVEYLLHGYRERLQHFVLLYGGHPFKGVDRVGVYR